METHIDATSATRKARGSADQTKTPIACDSTFHERNRPRSALASPAQHGASQLNYPDNKADLSRRKADSLRGRRALRSRNVRAQRKDRRTSGMTATPLLCGGRFNPGNPVAASQPRLFRGFCPRSVVSSLWTAPCLGRCCDHPFSSERESRFAEETSDCDRSSAISFNFS